MDATAKSPENCNFIQYSTWRKGIVKWKSGMARPEEDAFGGRDGWVTHVVTLTDAETPIRLLGAVPIDGSREQQGDGQPREIELHGHILGHRATPGRVAMAAAARYRAQQRTMLRREVCEHLIRQAPAGLSR